MKYLSTAAMALALISTSLAGSFGPPPWAQGGYYNGQFDGKYQAAATGKNLAGVIGFAVVDGAPPSRITETQSEDFFVVARNTEFGVDPFQNYFMIFVEGRTYTGTTIAAVDIASKKITGALSGTAPQGIQPLTASNNTTADTLPILNRGLDGAFTAKIKSDKAVFTFRGTGQLSTPANLQTVSMEVDITPPPAAIGDAATNVVMQAQIQTETTPFDVVGIKTSSFSSNAVTTATAN